MIGPSAALLAGMMAWVSSVTGLPLAPTPRIIVDTVWPYTDGTQAYEYPGEIHLKSSWDQSNPVDRGYLAHELVHILQDARHLQFRCNAERERLAYAVQALYDSIYGVDFWMDHEPLWLAKLEVCR